MDGAVAGDTGIPLIAQLDPKRFDSIGILKQVAAASRQLAELKGITVGIPNREVLINTLGLQEAKDSSAIENIVTTHDQLFREASLPEAERSAAGKEVLRYVLALRLGHDAVARSGLLTSNDIIRIQAALELNQAGFRKLPGTALKNQFGETVYTPPDPQYIVPLMTELERFINQDDIGSLDPLVKMAIAHFQFESIHPFYDGNGRTGRIINVLYLVKEKLLDTPALYMSRFIIQTKSEYYRLLRAEDFEREADYVGLYIMALDGWPIDSAPDLWRRMAAQSPGSIKFASSHPTTAERFAIRPGRVTTRRFLARGASRRASSLRVTYDTRP